MLCQVCIRHCRGSISYRDTGYLRKIIGIRDTEGNNCRYTGYCKKIYALLTKREVKMVGYWPSSKNEANIQPF